MVASSPLLMNRLSLCDLASIWSAVCALGSTIAAPEVGFTLIWEPSVYMYMSWDHLR